MCSIGTVSQGASTGSNRRLCTSKSVAQLGSWSTILIMSSRTGQLVGFATPYLASIISTASSTTCAIDASSGDQFMSSILGQKT